MTGRKPLPRYLCMLVCCAGILLSACTKNKTPGTPVQVCKAVTTALLGFTPADDVEVSEQEIHGERIVVHLGFGHPDLKKVKAVCVYGFDRYNEEGKQQLYRKLPTRMAINSQQISEKHLLAAIKKAGLEYDSAENEY